MTGLNYIPVTAPALSVQSPFPVAEATSPFLRVEPVQSSFPTQPTHPTSDYLGYGYQSFDYSQLRESNRLIISVERADTLYRRLQKLSSALYIGGVFAIAGVFVLFGWVAIQMSNAQGAVDYMKNQSVYSSEN